MLSMPIGIRPMTPGIANWSAPGVLSTSVYRPKPLPPCRGSVTAVMYSTLGADRTTGKLQFDANTVVRFEPGGPADAGPGGAGAVAFPARTAVAGRDQVRAARCGRAASVVPRAGQGIGAVPGPCAGVFRAVAGRGLPEHASRFRNQRRRARRAVG